MLKPACSSRLSRKFKANPLYGDAKIASSSEANTPHVSSKAISQTCYKAKALFGSTKIASSGEANAYNTYDKAKLASSKTKQIAFKKLIP